MNEPVVKVSNNARSAEELDGILNDVSEVLGFPAENGNRIFLESAEPPFEIIIRVAEIIDALGVIGKGVSVCARLYERLKKRVKGRRVQILFEAPGPNGKGIVYPVDPETPNEAIAKIAYDCQREVEPPSKTRFWFGDRWMTYEEYRQSERLGS